MKQSALITTAISFFFFSCGAKIKSTDEYKTAEKFVKLFSAENRQGVIDLVEESSLNRITGEEMDYAFTSASIKGYQGKEYELCSYSTGKYMNENPGYTGFMFCWKGEQHKAPQHRIEVVVVALHPDKVMAFRMLEGKDKVFQLPAQGMSVIGKAEKVYIVK